MQQYDARVDAYIGKSAPFAKPILEHVRRVVHEVSPLITETIKWGMPFFEYKGLVCQMAAFKQHAAFGFWRASRLNDPHHLLKLGGENEESAGGSFGRVYKIEDLPSEDALKQFVVQAMHLNEIGDKGGNMSGNPKKAPAVKKELVAPDYLLTSLDENPKAKETFEKFSPSNKKEYIEWLLEAKTDATRQKRLETTIEWLTEGKTRMWKYK